MLVYGINIQWFFFYYYALDFKGIYFVGAFGVVIVSFCFCLLVLRQWFTV